MGQFNLPKSSKMMPPKKVNAVLDMQSDAAIGMPTKVKVASSTRTKTKTAGNETSIKTKCKDLKMPFDGFGNFLRLHSWVVDATNSVKIRADRHDDEDNNFTAVSANCITKDGQTAVTQNIPLNSRRLVSVADPIDPQDAATKALRRHQDAARRQRADHRRRRRQERRPVDHAGRHRRVQEQHHTGRRTTRTAGRSCSATPRRKAPRCRVGFRADQLP